MTKNTGSENIVANDRQKDILWKGIADMVDDKYKIKIMLWRKVTFSVGCKKLVMLGL